MELIIKTNNEDSIAKIIALAKNLDVCIEQHGSIKEDKNDREETIKRILNFKASAALSFGEPLEWQLNEREDRELPFS